MSRARVVRRFRWILAAATVGGFAAPGTTLRATPDAIEPPVATTSPATNIAPGDTPVPEPTSAAQRAHGVMTASFRFRPAAAEPSAVASDAPAVFVNVPRDDEIVELEEFTVVSAQTRRDMLESVDRDLARLRAEEFDWRRGGRFFRKHVGRFQIDGGLWWALVPANAGGAGTAANLPFTARVDLLRISW